MPKKKTAKRGRPPGTGTRISVTDEQLALTVFLARRGASRSAIARGTGVSLRMVWYLIDRHCPNAPSLELPVGEALYLPVRKSKRRQPAD